MNQTGMLVLLAIFAFWAVVITILMTYYWVVQGIKRVAATVKALTTALAELAKLRVAMVAMVKKLNEAVTVAGSLAAELAYLRQASTGTTEAVPSPNFGPQQVQRSAANPIPFPTSPFERYQVVEDAKVEDTDIDLLNQTDQELTELERVENLRKMGIEVADEDEPKPGVEVESE